MTVIILETEKLNTFILEPWEMIRSSLPEEDMDFVNVTRVQPDGMVGLCDYIL